MVQTSGMAAGFEIKSRLKVVMSLKVKN